MLDGAQIATRNLQRVLDVRSDVLGRSAGGSGGTLRLGLGLLSTFLGHDVWRGKCVCQCESPSCHLDGIPRMGRIKINLQKENKREMGSDQGGSRLTDNAN